MNFPLPAHLDNNRMRGPLQDGKQITLVVTPSLETIPMFALGYDLVTGGCGPALRLLSDFCG